MSKVIPRLYLAIIAIVVIAGGSALGILSGVANAQLQPAKYEYKIIKVTVLSNKTTADGITYRSLALSTVYSGDVEGTGDAWVAQEINLKTGIGRATSYITANVKILGRGPDKINFANELTYTGVKDGIPQLEGRQWWFNGQGALKGVEGHSTTKGLSLQGGIGEGQFRFGPEVVDTMSPISYAALGIGIVLVVVSAVLFTRKKKV